jgi:biofilm PGA synthesis N-glycosyltransferase PgaC
VAVVGEMLAIRRELYVPIPRRIISDDVYLCMQVLRAGRRVVFVADAVCVEGASASPSDEVARRRRITASRFQLLCSPSQWPWRRPGVLFALVSHKFLRLAVPWLLAAALLASLALVLGPDTPAWAWVLLLAQVAAYSLAAVGAAGAAPGRLARPARIAAFFVAGHAASVSGAIAYLTGRASPAWQRVRRRPTGQAAPP